MYLYRILDIFPNPNSGHWTMNMQDVLPNSIWTWKGKTEGNVFSLNRHGGISGHPALFLLLCSVDPHKTSFSTSCTTHNSPSTPFFSSIDSTARSLRREAISRWMQRRSSRKTCAPSESPSTLIRDERGKLLRESNHRKIGGCMRADHFLCLV